MSWRLASSLVQLRTELDALAPERSKASDGAIGDAAHRSRPSRHNPNAHGVVCALDVTDDPAGGCPIHVIADRVRLRPHPNLDYIISDGRIAGRRTGWRWHAYTGSNRHERHAHFGVGAGRDGSPTTPYDDTTTWGVTALGSADLAAGVKAATTPRRLRRGSRGADVRGLQRILIGAGLLAPGDDDGIFGGRTEEATKRLQAQLGVAVDGDVGPATHAAIARLLESIGGT